MSDVQRCSITVSTVRPIKWNRSRSPWKRPTTFSRRSSAVSLFKYAIQCAQHIINIGVRASARRWPGRLGCAGRPHAICQFCACLGRWCTRGPSSSSSSRGRGRGSSLWKTRNVEFLANTLKCKKELCTQLWMRSETKWQDQEWFLYSDRPP